MVRTLVIVLHRITGGMEVEQKGWKAEWKLKGRSYEMRARGNGEKRDSEVMKVVRQKGESRVE